MAVPQEQVIIDWITSLGWDIRPELGFPLVAGPYIQRSPDQIVHITGSGGPGFTTEEPATDASLFQARVRGGQNDQAGASVAASALDTLILAARFPVVVDEVTLALVARLGSGPTVLGGGPDDAYRYEYVCDYLIVMGV